jgi:hypothetical protein
VFDERVAVFFDWLEHSLPYSLRESTDHSVVMVQILLGPLVMVSNGEHCWSKFVQELGSLLDVVEIVIGLVRVLWVSE